MQRYVDDILFFLEGFDFENLENDPNIIYALSADFKLIYYNLAWLNFAKENGGEPCISETPSAGTLVFSAINESLKNLYSGEYQKIYQTQKIRNHDFEYSNKSLSGIFHQTVYPLLNHKGLLIVNNIVKRNVITGDVKSLFKKTEDQYTWPTGFITQCIHCRRVQRVAEPAIWDWVPEWVENIPANNSSSLCSPCFDYYYNQLPMRKLLSAANSLVKT